mmetsp:Transcript_5417/g.10596  ORF Transcript_5417/g.10596 Transcript_5417/m.10596 type:complete len:95 (-) Transcript_5417:195-479(-)
MAFCLLGVPISARSVQQYGWDAFMRGFHISVGFFAVWSFANVARCLVAASGLVLFLRHQRRLIWFQSLKRELPMACSIRRPLVSGFSRKDVLLD